MATDSQGRPLSDDGQWAWNGTEWVPANDPGLSAPAPGSAADAPATPSTPASDEPDAGATMIAPSPFAGGTPGQGAPAGYGSTPPAAQGASQPPYGSPAGPSGAPGYGSQQAPGYGNAPGYGGTPPAAGYGAAPGGFGAPAAPPKSKKPIILAVIGVLVVVAVVLVLVLVVFKGDDKSSTATQPGGKYTCDVAGQDLAAKDKPAITFKDGGAYDLSGSGDSGKYSVAGGTVTFTGGDLNGISGQYDGSTKTVKLKYKTFDLTCKP